jgi:hypothetical protein
VTIFDHARFQPATNHSPSGKRPELTEHEIMVDVVECRFQVRVENPLPFRVFALDDLVYRLDRIVASTARPVG